MHSCKVTYGVLVDITYSVVRNYTHISTHTAMSDVRTRESVVGQTRNLSHMALLKIGGSQLAGGFFHERAAPREEGSFGTRVSPARESCPAGLLAIL